MDNDVVFAADVEVDGQLRSRSAERHASHHASHHHHPQAEHGTSSTIKGVLTEPERTPLLADSGDRSSLKSSSNSFSDESDGEQEWAGTAEFKDLPWWKRPSIAWLLPLFCLSTLAYGGIVVPKLNLILSLVCREYLTDRSKNDHGFTPKPVIFGIDNPQCQIPEVQSLVSKFTLYANLITGIFSAITSPKLGALSDRFGRNRVMALITSGLMAEEVITIIAASYPDTISVNWILLGYFFDGMCGSFIAAMAVTHSYASDCSPPAKRSVIFAMFHGILFSGIAAGPVIAGYIIKATGELLTVFYIALACHATFVLVVIFFLPESLSKDRQAAGREKHRLLRSENHSLSWRSWLKEANLLAPLSILYPRGEGSSHALRRNLLLLSVVDATIFGVAMGSMAVVVIYSEYAFGWGNLETSIFVSIVNTCRVLVLLVFLPLFISLFRGNYYSGSANNHPDRSRRHKNSGSDNFDLNIIRVAVLFDTLGYLGYAVVRTGPLFIVSGAIASIGGIGSPTLQSALTKTVPPDRTGQLLGATGLLHALARIVAPTIFNLIYSATVGKFTQTVFICLASTFGLAFVLSLFIRPHIYLADPEDTSTASASETASTRSLSNRAEGLETEV
ncbi:MAG: hypothetical protein M1819_003981 [Sarea resinae]|nr:MAG: hypothetical protein M1819_003981 [Sarea resinae]